MRRGPWIAVACLLAVAIGAGAYAWATGAERAPSRRPRPAARVSRESARWMPELVRGLYLGMELAEARAARAAMMPELDHALPTEPALALWSETFPNGARAIYGFRGRPARLDRVQVMSLLPDMTAIAPHLEAMNDRYGPPSAVWDCPDTGGVPTRRFNWRRGATTISDVFLVYGERVSSTLYIASSATIDRSLRMARCARVTDRAALERFPVAPAAGMRSRQGVSARSADGPTPGAEATTQTDGPR